MSASPVFSSAASGRPFLFPAPADTQALKKLPVNASSLLSHLGALPRLSTPITPASRLEARPAPEMAPAGIPELDALIGGLPRGCMTEICGTASSGRTSILLAALAHATRRGEVCALVDASDALDPTSAAAAGVEMGRLLWVRCGKKNPPRRHGDTEEKQEQSSASDIENRDAVNSERRNVLSKRKHAMPLPVSPCLRGENRIFPEARLEQVLQVTDLLLQSNGFGMIALDLSDILGRSARRIPLTSWFRFRRAVEHTPAVLLVLEQQPIAGSCSSLLLQVSGVRSQVSGKKLSARGSQLAGKKHLAAGQHPIPSLSHTELFDEFQIEVELLRSRLERKPAQSATTNFCSRASWAG